jgi:putative nucleotidyltransferase with HDIG domain
MKLSSEDIPNWAYDAARLLMKTLKQVDPATYYHCCRVGELSRKLARDVGLSEYQQKVAEFSGLFHDIGKIAVPQDVVHKPGKLTPEEYEIMKKHSAVSEDIVRSLEHHAFFEKLLPIIRGHHERMDGEGYPDKLMGDNIPLVSRVILVVDTFDAMSQTRSYRKGMPLEMVYAELKKYSDTQFDSQVVKIFLDAHRFWERQNADRETVEFLHRKTA